MLPLKLRAEIEYWNGGRQSLGRTNVEVILSISVFMFRWRHPMTLGCINGNTFPVTIQICWKGSMPQAPLLEWNKYEGRYEDAV